MTISFKQRANASTALWSGRIPINAPQEAETLAQSLMGAPEPPPVYTSKEAAETALRLNRPRGRSDGRTCGDRFERCASHITYAWMTIRRRIGKAWHVGQVALHVYHATKGWKISHGHNSPVFKSMQPQNEVIGVAGS